MASIDYKITREVYDWIQLNHLFLNVHIAFNYFTYMIKMFFFNHSYITIIIAVITIWAMPVYSNNIQELQSMVQFY